MLNNLAERKFKEWLDKNNIPYWYIDQSLDSFSPALKKYLVKRPDFMILLPNFGLIFVDVKNYLPAEKYEKFFLSATEIDNYLSMQRIFNLPTWFVISNENYHYRTWFWIPVSEVTRSGFVFDTKEQNRKCYSIPVKEFIQVADTDNLERIFSKLFKI